jgi:hypothetical protein
MIHHATRNSLVALCGALVLVFGTAATVSASTVDQKPAADEPSAKTGVLLEDDFSDDSNGWGGDEQPGSYTAGIEDGALVFDMQKNVAAPVR